MGTKGIDFKISKTLGKLIAFLVSLKVTYPSLSHPLLSHPLELHSLFSPLKHFTSLQNLKFTGGFSC